MSRPFLISTYKLSATVYYLTNRSLSRLNRFLPARELTSLFQRQAYSAIAASRMPNKDVINGNKRKAAQLNGEPATKKPRSDLPDNEKFGIVDRRFYPPEMTNARCHQYINGEIPRPLQLLEAALKETKGAREAIAVKDAVIHWYKCDLRVQDNKALHLASVKAKSKGVPLICIYIVSPQDFEAHLTSPVRVDFILRTLEVLKADLAVLDIPLYVETVEKRKTIPARIFELCEKWGSSHIFANIEYEVDELRREAMMVRKGLEKGISLTAVHDTCVVAPGELTSGSGKQYAVYTPWFRSWVAYLHGHPKDLDLYDMPFMNPPTTKKTYEALFNSLIPSAPENKTLSEDEKTRFRSLWPPGEKEAHLRLTNFLKERIGRYKEARNIPSEIGTAVLSVHFAAGTLSARTAVNKARSANSVKNLDGGNAGIATWISEVAWRDFYKHVLANWPYVW
jgi:deoxyribodipyrimidine photo-lyase